MPKLHYAGQTFELSPSDGQENPINRIDDMLIEGRSIVGHTKVPTNMILGVARLANGNDLIFSISGSLPIAFESDEPQALQ